MTTQTNLKREIKILQKAFNPKEPTPYEIEIHIQRLRLFWNTLSETAKITVLQNRAFLKCDNDEWMICRGFPEHWLIYDPNDVWDQQHLLLKCPYKSSDVFNGDVHTEINTKWAYWLNQPVQPLRIHGHFCSTCNAWRNQS